MELEFHPPYAEGLVWIHRVRWVQLGAVLVELPADLKRGRRGRRGKRVLLHSEECRHQRDRRPEPTVKAQHVFGTNKLADMAAR